MINNTILEEMSKRSPFRALTPADMIYYSNLHNKAGLEMGFPGIGTFKYLNKPEEDRSKKKYKEFSYTINDIGFRGAYPDPSIKGLMGFFGCSITFGEGLPEEDNFPYQLSQHYSKECLNLGMCGAGSHRIALMFQAATRIWDIETAIVTLPNWGRFNYIDQENNFLSIIPPHPHASIEGNAVRLAMIKHFSDQYLMSATRDAASFIVSIAREKNIKLILGSWDEETREILKAGLNYDAAPFVYNANIESARDNVHPGPTACANYTNTIKHYILNNKYV
jgi:hypothetical protein